ncbi:MAG: heme ABC exporter ATP-binding protein CcmA [Alphaproteobacteria bacterium]|nr:heme ABC exporter ATP-binding protein CcmA [Alphaproteobacteria bacterium]
MLSLDNISIEIDNKIIIPNLTFTLDVGDILYITGKNGCGKTSLLKAISGLKTIKSGSIKIFDYLISDLQKPYCVYIGHENAIEPDLLIKDQLAFWADTYGSGNLLDASIEYWGIRELLELPASRISKGLARKISLSRLLSSYADIWLLDEPEANLDTDNIKLLNNAIISKANSGGIILIATHGKTEIETGKILKLDEQKPHIQMKRGQ